MAETWYSELTVIQDAVPPSFFLYPTYPNPFNLTFTVPFTLNEQMAVKISLYNVQGQQVMHILNQELSAGDYRFQVNADKLSSGIYFLKTMMHTSTPLNMIQEGLSMTGSHAQKIVLMK